MENCIKIGLDSLQVWVAKPGLRYDRSRFDWTGFIPQVSLNGHTFCTPEEADWHPNGTGGEGICNEFKADDTVMGADDSDNLFLKPGVGLLERPNKDSYDIITPYKVVKPFPCTVNHGDCFVDFHLDEIPFKGISYKTDKHISVIDNMLIITTTVTNTGEKPIELDEYNHNFLSMNGLGAHPQVKLSMHKDFYNSTETPGLVMNEDSITFTDDIRSSFMIYCRAPVVHSPLRWELRDEKAGLAVQEWGDFDVTKYMVWGGPHTITPEIYGNFKIPPNQKTSWTRLWKFT